MSIKKIHNKLRVILGYKLRNITANIVFRWILNHKSQPVVVSQKSAIVFSPHQDDETLGCGGVIALKREQGVPVRVVFITDGCNGRPKWIQPEEIVNVRKQEAITALNILGVASTETLFLEQTDGALADLPNDKRQHLIEQLAQLLQSFSPEEVYVPHRQDLHVDHEATYQLVEAAIAKSGLEVELWQYPIWMFWQNPLSFQLDLHNLADVYRISITSVQNKKSQAIKTYNSQISGLTNGFLKRFFLPHELFFKN